MTCRMLACRSSSNNSKPLVRVTICLSILQPALAFTSQYSPLHALTTVFVRIGVHTSAISCLQAVQSKFVQLQNRCHSRHVSQSTTMSSAAENQSYDRQDLLYAHPIQFQLARHEQNTLQKHLMAVIEPSYAFTHCRLLVGTCLCSGWAGWGPGPAGHRGLCRRGWAVWLEAGDRQCKAAPTTTCPSALSHPPPHITEPPPCNAAKPPRC